MAMATPIPIGRTGMATTLLIKATTERATIPGITGAAITMMMADDIIDGTTGGTIAAITATSGHKQAQARLPVVSGR